MFVYSKKIIQFVNEIKLAIKEILSREVGLKVLSNRFYNRLRNASYPIHVVVYNNKSMLGYFDSDFLEVGFHECLMHQSRELLHNVIRHELAHYVTFINHGQTIRPHASEFRAFCEEMGWGEEVYRASFALKEDWNATQPVESAVLRKVQKLMALTTSSNKNEAEQAMIKSQQLLMKHNIESRYIDGEDDERIVLKRILKQKKENAKLRSIATILQTFFVATVYNRGGEFLYLEILGSAVNVDIAEYVANVLDSELDRLWSNAQREYRLKGMVAKNSFFLGLARGYCDKIEALKREYGKDVSNALMVIEKKLMDAKEMAYQRLVNRKSSGNYCSASSELGEMMGRQLNINPAINKGVVSTGLLLTQGGS